MNEMILKSVLSVLFSVSFLFALFLVSQTPPSSNIKQPLWVLSLSIQVELRGHGWRIHGETEPLTRGVSIAVEVE